MQLTKEELLDAAQAAGYSRGLVDADLMLVAINAYCAQADARPVARFHFDDSELDALYEAIEWAKDEGLPGTAEHLQAIFDAHDPEASAPGLSDAPRYAEWRHLVDHGQWSDGVPAWARDHEGRMNDVTAMRAVIEELSTLLTRASAETVAEPSALPAGWHINVELRKPEGGAQSMLHVVAPNGAGHITYYAKSECNEALLSALHAAMQAAQQPALPAKAAE